jgi:hypothetical protein
MAHYAEVDENNIVTRVLVVDDSVKNPQEFLSIELGLGGNWVKTSYNTHNGVHRGPDGEPDGKPQLHYNFAGIGYNWDGIGFYPPQPYPSWTLNKNTYLWDSPVLRPETGGPYAWNEEQQSWDKV